MGGKGKCGPCGGSGHDQGYPDGKCIWCGGSGRMSYKYFYWSGVADGMDRQREIFLKSDVRIDSWVNSLLDTLDGYGSREALCAATQEPDLMELVREARRGQVKPLMEVVAAVRRIGNEADTTAFFDKNITYILDEIAPIRYG